MSRLDCENLETTLESLSLAFEMPVDEIETRLIGLDILHEENEAYKCLFREFCVDRPLKSFDEVCYFHASRVRDETCFQSGLLPLRQTLDGILEFLYELGSNAVNRNEWEEFLKGALEDLRWKRKNHDGPFGFFFRDLIDSPEDNVHYLDAPEIVFNIGRRAQDRFGFDFLKNYSDRTKPVVVKFFSGQKYDHILTAKALFYALIKLRGFDVRLYDHSFNGKGNAVPKASIIAIDWLG